jgi:MYXO-CTERM domain-containing protein
VHFDDGRLISRVRLTNGNSALGANESSTSDLVVMDDFIYGEPRRIAEPDTAALALGALLAAFAVRRRSMAALHWPRTPSA